MSELSLTNRITCLEVGRAVRYSLHDVFRALPFVPREFYLFLEFSLSGSLQFYLRVISIDGDSSYETEVFEIHETDSGVSDWVGALPGKVAGLLPGRYIIEVVEADSEGLLGVRRMFFGEM